jgi:hypothetical protein
VDYDIIKEWKKKKRKNEYVRNAVKGKSNGSRE